VYTAPPHTAAQPALTIAAVLAAIVAVSFAATIIHQARPETLRKQIDMQPRTTVANALAACVHDIHRHADDPTDHASVAEARRVRGSARSYIAEHGTNVGQVCPQQHALGPVTVLNARRAHHHRDQRTHGVGHDEALAAVDLLTRVITPG
jgi:hypothetical protein